MRSVESVLRAVPAGTASTTLVRAMSTTTEPTDATAVRTYEVRTYGCQMNVHDSERLVRAARGRPATCAPPTARPPTSSSSTPARCGRTPTTSSTATSATSRRSRRRTRACRSRSAAASRRRTAARSPAARRGSTSCSAPTTSGRCRCCSSGRGIKQEAQVEILESLEVFPSTLPTRRESRVRRLGVDQRRLQQHLHVLHRAVAARHGEGPPARRRPRRGRGARRRGRPRGHAARPERQLLRRRVRRPARVRQAAARLRRDRRSRAGAVHHRRTRKDFTDDVIAAMAETPNVMPPLHMPLQSGSDAVLKAMRRSYRAGALPRHHRPGPRRDAGRRDHHRHHRRLPGRDRRGLRRRPSTSCAQARFAGAFTFQYSKRPGTPAATMPDQLPEGGRAGALRAAASRCRTRSPGRRTSASSAAVLEVLVAEGEGRKDGATHRLSGRAPDNRLVHFAVPAGVAAAAAGRRRDRRGDLRRAAPPGRRRHVRRAYAGPAAGDAWQARAGRRAGARPACCSACRRRAPAARPAVPTCG